MSQVIRTQRPATSSNANSAALEGFNLDSPDFPRLDSIILDTAKKKDKSGQHKGGYFFQAGVLFTKVCKEVKALAGLTEHQRLPDNIAGYIQTGCGKVAAYATKELLDNGFNPLRQSNQKVVMDYRNTRVSRQVSQVFEKIQSFTDQLRDIHWEIFSAKELLTKLEATQPKDREAAVLLEVKTEKLKEKITRMEKLERSIKNEQAYHAEQLQKESDLGETEEK